MPTKAMNHVVVFPVVVCRMFGFPDLVKLSAAEFKAMERIHLGGMEALRTSTYKCSCRTITALIAKGLLDSHGVTALGRAVGEHCGTHQFNEES